MNTINRLAFILILSSILICNKSFAQPLGVNIAQCQDTYYDCLNRCKQQNPGYTVAYYTYRPCACYCMPEETGRPLDAFNPGSFPSTPTPSPSPTLTTIISPIP